MDNKEILKKMMLLRDNMEKEINANLVEGELPDIIINDIKYLQEVKYLEEVEGQAIEKETNIFLIIGEKDGNTFYKYYNENMELIAYQDNNIGEIIPSEAYINKKQTLLKEIANISKDGKSLLEIEAHVEAIEKIAKALGKDPKDIEDIEELDLEQEIDEENIPKENTKKLDVREETSLNENIKGTTLGKKLGVDNITLPNGEKLTDGEKLARVSTSSLNEYTKDNSNMADSFVIIRSNGDAIPVGPDILEPDTNAGTNSINNDLTINVDGTVDRESNTSSYKITNGNGREYIKVGYDEVSGRKIQYSQWSNEKGEYVNTELKTNRDTFMNNDSRQYLRARDEGIREATETLERAEHHEEHGDIETDVTLVDNNENNDSHTHIEENDYIPNTNTTWRQFANECGYRGIDAIECAINEFEKRCKENPESSNEEIVEETIEKQNEDYRNPNERKY